FTKFYTKTKKKLFFFKIFSGFGLRKNKNPEEVKYHQNKALSQKKL
ncbi:unnamed protein product, partial [Staurois parvus]